MDMIILDDGVFTLVEVTKELLSQVKIVSEVDCFSLCDILRIYLTDYLDAPHNLHMMKDGSGYFYGCICNS